MRTVHVSTGKPYDIFIERGLLDKAGEYAKSLSSATRAVLITDTNVAPLYKWRVLNSLSAAGFEVATHVFQAGEESKHLGTIAEMYKTLADSGMTRKDMIVALGGGVCGDMAGFAAATYLRGIDFMQIPTSLLAQVDSSVGGKTGVDLPQGKNLVGAFHQPIAVLIDPDTLNTLPDRFITDGMGEVIKYGCIKDAKFFEFLENENALEHIEDVIETCVSIKRDVVSRDEHEKGERMLLNFGHTWGHAIEKVSGYTKYTHGEAVAIGMVKAVDLGVKLGETPEGVKERILAVLEKWHLPTTTNLPVEELFHTMCSDKKKLNGKIYYVMINNIGESKTRPLSEQELHDLL
jgi:3-dehydroquinate synthase